MVVEADTIIVTLVLVHSMCMQCIASLREYYCYVHDMFTPDAYSTI